MVNAANKIKRHQFCLVSISNPGAQSEPGRVLAGTKEKTCLYTLRQNVAWLLLTVTTRIEHFSQLQSVIN